MITNIMNEKKLAPIHLATEMNKVKALEVMGRHKDVIDIQQGTIAENINNEGEYSWVFNFISGGEHGRTALHLAAIYDHDDCARILVSASLIKTTQKSYFCFLTN